MDILASVREDAPVQEVRCCVHWTVVRSRFCGMAATIPENEHPHGERVVEKVGHLTRRTALELAEWSLSGHPLEASIGLAALNSLVEIEMERCVELNAADLLVDKGKGKDVAIIGHFPFLPRLRESSRNLYVIEKRPAPGEFPEQAAGDILPRVQVVGITGTALVNKTFRDLIKLCPEAYKVVIGPSTPLSPVMFDHGIDVLSGVHVEDPATLLRFVSEGAHFRQVKGVKMLTLKK